MFSFCHRCWASACLRFLASQRRRGLNFLVVLLLSSCRDVGVRREAWVEAFVCLGTQMPGNVREPRSDSTNQLSRVHLVMHDIVLGIRARESFFWLLFRLRRDALFWVTGWVVLSIAHLVTSRRGCRSLIRVFCALCWCSHVCSFAKGLRSVVIFCLFHA